MRLFVGIPLPREIVDTLYYVVQDWKNCADGVKYVEPENMHITLKFIGDVDAGRAERISTILEQVSFAPFSVHLEGVGAFPSVNRPRVLWIGVNEGFEDTVHLSMQIDGLLSAEGVPRETRKFHPHVTIGRVKSYSPTVPEKIREYAGRPFGSFVVERFVLYKSTLTPNGPVYEELNSYGVER